MREVLVKTVTEFKFYNNNSVKEIKWSNRKISLFNKIYIRSNNSKNPNTFLLSVHSKSVKPFNPNNS